MVVPRRALASATQIAARDRHCLWISNPSVRTHARADAVRGEAHRIPLIRSPTDHGEPMPSITTKDGAKIFYKDWGSGQPVVFSHGWPLNADAWDEQLNFFASNGYRAIAHDRRGNHR